MLLKRYRMPAIGTQLPPAENEFAQPNATNQDDVLRYQQAAAQQDAFDKTELVKTDYLGRFASWLVYSYQAGRAIGPTGMGDPNATPPQPPKGYMAVVVQNETSIGWDVQQIGPPVCAVPEYTRINPPQH